MNPELVFIRLATLYFSPPPKDYRPWSFCFGKTKTETMKHWDLEDKLRLLVCSQIHLEKEPEMNDDGYVMVPENERKYAEAAIETAANMIAVTERCKRSISSPTPYIAFLPQNKESQAWLEETNGILLPSCQAVIKAQFNVSFDNSTIGFLHDRPDGVALLAEALAHDHATGKFHEFLRLFERAFKRSTTKLVNPLAGFLATSGMGYEVEEIKKWVIDLRHPATHADTRPGFVMESDIRPVIGRIEQAAYDVLFNKIKWRDPSIERRKVLSPTAGTLSSRSRPFLTRGKRAQLNFQLLDCFGSYPLDLSAGLTSLPEGGWSKNSQVRQNTSPE